MNRSSKAARIVPNFIPQESQIALRQAIFTRLVLRHERDLTCFARRLGGNEDRAQDLVQDTLVRAYRAFLDGRLREDGHTGAWLQRILTNLFINDYTRRRKWQTLSLDLLTSLAESGLAETQAAAKDIPGIALLASTLDEELEQALEELPDGLRFCVILIDMQGLEYAEAAHALQIPIGTVRSRLSRARGQLHGRLQGYAQKHGLV